MTILPTMRVQVPGIPTALTLLASLLPALALACGGSPKNTGDSNEPSRQLDRLTLATLSGPLCKDDSCRCAEPGNDAGLPVNPGVKRYEVRIGPVDNELWVEVDDMVLYKGVERATDCFYIDLATGKHPVSLLARQTNGFAARVAISELGKLGRYQTFEFACGSPGPCGIEEMREWQASLVRYQRSVHDPCGSTRIRNVHWQSGKTPDRIHPEELTLDLILDIYGFEPRHESGHPECKDKF